jgi:pilus assembly protein CpaF
VHANSADDSIIRLETLASMSDVPVPADTLRDQTNSAIDVVVHLGRSADGHRRVYEVAALVSRHRQPFRLAPITVFDFDREHPRGGEFRPVGISPYLAERIHRAGLPPPAGFEVLSADRAAAGREVQG